MILEFITSLLAIAVYGTEGRPRHPLIINCIRLIAFSGAAIAELHVLALTGDIRIPLLATIVWLTCGVIVLFGEYDLGSRKVAMAAIATVVLLALTAAFRVL